MKAVRDAPERRRPPRHESREPAEPCSLDADGERSDDTPELPRTPPMVVEGGRVGGVRELSYLRLTHPHVGRDAG